MQEGYEYELTEKVGENFGFDFKPDLTPKEMLELGVFGGKYMTDCQKEFPKDWFKKAKLCHEMHDPKINYFGINASQPLSVWRKKGWINKKYDPRGWFQWYCRYYMGRRIIDEDEKQISRWKKMRRHVGQVKGKTVEQKIFIVGQNKGKYYYTGHMILEKCKKIIKNSLFFCMSFP